MEKINKARHLIDGVSVFCAFDEIIEIKDLKENPQNPNTHPDEQVELLAEIIKKTGWRAPITVSTLSGFIVKGHGRLMAAKLLGCKKVPVEYQTFNDMDEEIAALLADNKIAKYAELDLKILEDLFEDFDFEKLDLTGFKQEDLESYFNDIEEDDIPEDIPLDKEKNGSTNMDFISFGNTKIILTEEEKTRFENFIKNFGNKNGNLFGLVAELLKNGAKNYEG